MEIISSPSTNLCNDAMDVTFSGKKRKLDSLITNDFIIEKETKYDTLCFDNESFSLLESNFSKSNFQLVNPSIEYMKIIMNGYEKMKHNKNKHGNEIENENENEKEKDFKDLKVVKAKGEINNSRLEKEEKFFIDCERIIGLGNTSKLYMEHKNLFNNKQNQLLLMTFCYLSLFERSVNSTKNKERYERLQKWISFFKVNLVQLVDYTEEFSFPCKLGPHGYYGNLLLKASDLMIEMKCSIL